MPESEKRLLELLRASVLGEWRGGVVVVRVLQFLELPGSSKW